MGMWANEIIPSIISSQLKNSPLEWHWLRHSFFSFYRIRAPVSGLSFKASFVKRTTDDTRRKYSNLTHNIRFSYIEIGQHNKLTLDRALCYISVTGYTYKKSHTWHTVYVHFCSLASLLNNVLRSFDRGKVIPGRKKKEVLIGWKCMTIRTVQMDVINWGNYTLFPLIAIITIILRIVYST